MLDVDANACCVQLGFAVHAHCTHIITASQQCMEIANFSRISENNSFVCIENRFPSSFFHFSFFNFWFAGSISGGCAEGCCCRFRIFIGNLRRRASRLDSNLCAIGAYIEDGIFLNVIPRYGQVSNLIISPSCVAHKHLVEKRGIHCTRSKRNSSTGNMLRYPSNWITRAMVLASHPPSVGGNRMPWDLCQSCCRPNQSAYFSQFIAICSSVNIVNFVCLQTAK